MKDNRWTNNESLNELSPQQLGSLNKLIKKDYPNFNPKKIHLLSKEKYKKKFIPYQEKFWKVSGEDIFNPESQLLTFPVAFVTPKPRKKRKAYITNTEKTKVYIHEAMHLLHHNNIYPTLYFKNVINVFLIEGLTEYLTKNFFSDSHYKSNSYQTQLRIIQYAITKKIVSKEDLKKFHLEGEISTSIAKLYELFIIAYLPKIIINIFSYLIKQNKVNQQMIDEKFLDLIKCFPEKNDAMIKTIIDYLKNSEDTEIKKQFIATLARFFYSHEFLKDWNLPQNELDAIIMILENINCDIDHEIIQNIKPINLIICIKLLKEYQIALNSVELISQVYQAELEIINSSDKLLILIDIKKFSICSSFFYCGNPISKINIIINDIIKLIANGNVVELINQYEKLNNIKNEIKDSHSDLKSDLQKYISALEHLTNLKKKNTCESLGYPRSPTKKV